MRALTYKLLIGFLGLTTLTTIGLGISTGVLSHENGAIKERFKEQSLSLKECQVSCQQCSGGDTPEPPAPSVKCSNMYRISYNPGIDGIQAVEKIISFGVTNNTFTELEKLDIQSPIIEELCTNPDDECDYTIDNNITIDSIGQLSITGNWGMFFQYLDGTQYHQLYTPKAIQTNSIFGQTSIYVNGMIGGDYSGIIVEQGMLVGEGDAINVNGSIQGYHNGIVVSGGITSTDGFGIKVGDIECGNEYGSSIGSNCVQMGNINAYLGTNETPLAAIKLKSVTANNNGNGIQVEESITAPYSAIDVASDLSSSQYPVITITGNIEATDNNDAISVTGNIKTKNGRRLFVQGTIQGNDQYDAIRVMGGSKDQYGVTGGITIDYGVNGQVSLGNVACGSKGEGNGVEKCISIGDVEAYMYSQEVGKSLPAISVGQITANDGSGIEVSQIDAYIYGVHVGENGIQMHQYGDGAAAIGAAAIGVDGNINSENLIAISVNDETTITCKSTDNCVKLNNIVMTGGTNAIYINSIKMVGEPNQDYYETAIFVKDEISGFSQNGIEVGGTISSVETGGTAIFVQDIQSYSGIYVNNNITTTDTAIRVNNNVTTDIGYGVYINGNITLNNISTDPSNGIYVGRDITVQNDCGIYVVNNVISKGSSGICIEGKLEGSETGMYVTGGITGSVSLGNVNCGDVDKNQFINSNCVSISSITAHFEKQFEKGQDGQCTLKEQQFSAISIGSITTTNGSAMDVNGNINCGNTDNNIVDTCVSISDITSYTQVCGDQFSSLKVGDITTHGGYGVQMGDILEGNDGIYIGSVNVGGSAVQIDSVQSSTSTGITISKTITTPNNRAIDVQGAITCGNEDNPITSNCVSIEDVNAYAYKVEYVEEPGQQGKEEAIPLPAININSIISNNSALNVGTITCGTSQAKISHNCTTIDSITSYSTYSPSNLSSAIFIGNSNNTNAIYTTGSAGINITGSISSYMHGIKVSGGVSSTYSNAIDVGGLISSTSENAVVFNSISSTSGYGVYIKGDLTGYGGLTVEGDVIATGDIGINVKHNITAETGGGIYIGGNVTAENAEAVFIVGNVSGYQGIYVGRSINTTTEAGIKVIQDIQCGNSFKNISSACISTGNIVSYTNIGSATPTLSVGAITSHGGSGIEITSIETDYVKDANGIHVIGNINVGNAAIDVGGAISCGVSTQNTPTADVCVQIGNVNAYMNDQTQTSQAVIDIGSITATNFQALNVGGTIQCGKPQTSETNLGINTNRNCVQMGGVTTYGQQNTSAVQISSINAYGSNGQTVTNGVEGSFNGIYIGGSVTANDGSGIYVSNSVAGNNNPAIYVGKVVSGTNGNGVTVNNGISSNNKNAIYVGKSEYTNYAIQGNVQIDGDVSQSIKVTGNIGQQLTATGVGSVSVTNSIGSLTANSITTSASVTKNIKQLTAGSVGDASLTQSAIQINGQIQCGSGTAPCVQLNSITSNKVSLSVGSITATNGNAINIGVSKTTSYAISGGININGNVQNAPITITGNLYALDVSGQVGNDATTTAIKAGSVLGNVELGSSASSTSEGSDIISKQAGEAIVQGSINVYGDIDCSGACINVQGGITSTSGNGDIYVGNSIGTLSAKSIDTVKITYDKPLSDDDIENVIGQIALYEQEDTTISKLTINSITNTPFITGLTNGNVQINTIKDDSISEIIISNINNVDDETYNVIGLIKLEKPNDVSPSVQISGIKNTFGINTITTPGKIDSIESENVKGECDSPDDPNDITLSPPPEKLTLVFDSTSSMTSIKIQDVSQNDKIIISGITKSFGITNLTTQTISNLTTTQTISNLTTQGTITNLTVEGTGSSLANVSLVDYATIGTINIEVPATTQSTPSAVISNIRLYPSGSTYTDSQLNIEKVYNNYNISKINTQGSIGTITASSIGSTDASTSTVLSVTGDITGIVSLGNVNCGNNGNSISTNCVSMSSISNYGGSGSNAVSISSIIAHGGNGITVDKSVTSDSGSAINVGQGLDVTKNELIAIQCGTGSSGINNDCVSIGNITAYLNTVDVNGEQQTFNTINIGHIQATGGDGAYITSINSMYDSIQVEKYIDSYQGTAISVGEYIKTLSKAISITGKITCGEKIDGGSSSPTSNNCIEFNDVEIYWDQPEAERKAAITVDNIKANNSNAITINNITADYNGVVISKGIVSNNSQALNVNDAITCGTPTNDTDTGIDVTSSCVSIGSVNSYMDDKTTGIYAITIEGITATGGSGIQIDGDITADYNGIEVSNGVYINGNGIGFTAQNINVQSESGKQAIYITNSDDSITSLSKTKQAVQIGGITCGNNNTLTTSNCVQMGDVTIFGEKINNKYPNATYINSITSYNNSNDIYINSDVKSDNGYVVYINGGLSGAYALQIMGKVKSTKGQGIYLGSDVSGTTSSISISGSVISSAHGIYVGKQITTGSIGSYKAITVGQNINDFETTPNAIRGNIQVNGGVNGDINIDNGGVGQISVDNSIGSLTAGGITTTATINGNVGQSLQVTGTVGGSSTTQAINIGSQITCGDGGSACVYLDSVKAGITTGVQINGVLESSYKAIHIGGKTTCGNTENPTGTGVDCISIGEVEAYAYEVETDGGKTVITPKTAINVNAAITSHKGNAIIIGGTITAGNAGISSSGINCGTSKEVTKDNMNCVTMGDIIIYGGTATYNTQIKSITSYNNSYGIQINGQVKSVHGNAIYVSGNLQGGSTALYVSGSISSTTSYGIRVMGHVTGTMNGIGVSGVSSTSGSAIKTGDITCGSASTNNSIGNCVQIGNVNAYLGTTIDETNSSNITYYSAVKTGSITASNNGYGLNVTGTVSAGYTAVQIKGTITSTNSDTTNTPPTVLIDGNIVSTTTGVLIDGNVLGYTGPAIQIGRKDAQEGYENYIHTCSGYAFEIFGDIKYDNMNSEEGGGIHVAKTDTGNGGNVESQLAGIVVDGNIGVSKDGIQVNGIITSNGGSGVNVKNIEISNETNTQQTQYGVTTGNIKIQNGIGVYVGTIQSITESATQQFAGLSDGISVGAITVSGNGITTTAITANGYGIQVNGGIISNQSQAIYVSDSITCGTPPNGDYIGTTITDNCVEMGDITIYGNQGKIYYPNATYIKSITSYNDSNGIYIKEHVKSENQYAIRIDGNIQATSGYGVFVYSSITCGNKDTQITNNCVQMDDVTTYGVGETSAISTGTITSYNNSNGVYVGGSINTNSGNGIKVYNGIIVNSSGDAVIIEKGNNTYAIQAQNISSGGILVGGDIITYGNSVYITGGVVSSNGDGIRVTQNIKSGSYNIGVVVGGGITASNYGIFVTESVESTYNDAIYVGGNSGDIQVNGNECSCPA